MCLSAPVHPPRQCEPTAHNARAAILQVKLDTPPPPRSSKSVFPTLLQKVRSFAAAAMWCSDAHVPPSSRPRGPCLSAQTRAQAAKGGRARERATRAACSSSSNSSESSCGSSSDSAGHAAVQCLTALSLQHPSNSDIAASSQEGGVLDLSAPSGHILHSGTRLHFLLAFSHRPTPPNTQSHQQFSPQQCQPTLLCACPGKTRAVSCCMWP
jgi:hypothetical protein